MLKYLTIVIVLLLGAGWGYHYYVSASGIYERATQKVLDNLTHSVASKDRTQIGNTLKDILSDSAQIRLEITFYSLSQASGSKPSVQEFDKASFLSFVDNILYTMDDYSYHAHIKRFDLNKDKKTAAVTFASEESGTGLSYYAGTSLNMQFESETTCEGEVVLDGAHPMLNKAVCKMSLRSLPEPGQEKKLGNPDTLREILR